MPPRGQAHRQVDVPAQRPEPGGMERRTAATLRATGRTAPDHAGAAGRSAGGRAAELGYLDGVAAPAVMMLSWP
jgi:hypothetical protein